MCRDVKRRRAKYTHLSSRRSSDAVAGALSNFASGCAVPIDFARHKHLVLLHPQLTTTTAPRNTCFWLHGRAVQSHHQLRSQGEADYARFGRFLAGESVGLCLSGGGARGIAHLGVIRALEEANVPIDYVGGTSQGSLVAALYARHLVRQTACWCAHLRAWLSVQSSEKVLPVLRKFAASFTTTMYMRVRSIPNCSSHAASNTTGVHASCAVLLPRAQLHAADQERTRRVHPYRGPLVAM